MSNILFICTLGRIRSKTAASLFEGSKYAGTDANADVKVTQELMDIEDLIVYRLDNINELIVVCDRQLLKEEYQKQLNICRQQWDNTLQLKRWSGYE